MATLVDTSIWIGHLHKPDLRLINLLELSDALMHPAILGEIAAGSLKNRIRILGDLKILPKVTEVAAEEVLEFIENRTLFGKGLSWVDIQILASCLANSCDLLTDDKRLRTAFLAIHS